MKFKSRTFLIGFILLVALGIIFSSAPATADETKQPTKALVDKSTEKATQPQKKLDTEKSAAKAALPQEKPKTENFSEKVTPLPKKPEEKIAQTPEAGKKIFGEKNCRACHTTTGPEKKIPVTERAAIKGPSLWFAGSKFRPGYLASWLEAPKAFRGVRWGTMDKGESAHPALPKRAAGAAAAYIESLRDNEMPKGTVTFGKKIPRRILRNARILFQKKQPCYTCHRVKIRKTVYRRPIKLGGFSGPHLIDAGRRLQPDFIVAFLKKPARYNPNGRMPVYSDKAFTQLSDKDINALAAYISSFKEKP